MIDFGFSINKSGTINLDTIDCSLFNKLCEVEPTAKLCISCGSCSATCTAAPFTGMSVRKVLLALQRGQDVRPMMSACMLCGKCTMVCPRGINTRNALLTIAKLYKPQAL